MWQENDDAHDFERGCVARKFWSELLLAADSPSPILMLIPKPFPDAILNFEISKKLIVSF